MHLLDHKLYKEDIRTVSALELPWERLEGKTIVVSGATGMVGSFFIDVIMCKPELNCHIIAIGRDEKKAKIRFSNYSDSPFFSFAARNINEKIGTDVKRPDFILHAASNTHPVAYATDPVGTVMTNIIGTNNLLELAAANQTERFVFLSSNEIYGENYGDVEKFDEQYCGYINCNTLRAGYPESKRCAEALCQAYIKNQGLDIVIPRLTRTFGPTMLGTDTKAISQFIRKGIAGEDIILKSAGTQNYSYTYAADAVSGILTILLKGRSGEAYNVSFDKGDMTLKELAGYIAHLTGKRVVQGLAEEVERAGYSVVTKARLDGAKLQKLGWKPAYSIQDGLKRTIEIGRACKEGYCGLKDKEYM